MHNLDGKSNEQFSHSHFEDSDSRWIDWHKQDFYTEVGEFDLNS